MFTVPEVTVFMSNRICQDLLEQFFGQQRQRGRTHENPNAAEFLKNTQALRVINSTCAGIRGNCRGSNNRNGKRKTVLTKVNTAPLSKRRRKY